MSGPFSIARQPHLTVGEGASLDIASRLVADGIDKVVVITGGRSIRGRERWSLIVERLLEANVEFIDATVRGEPSPSLVDAVVESVRSDIPGCRGVVAIGGGSVIDAGKAVASMLSLNAEETTGGVRTFLEGVGDRSPRGSTLPLYAVPSTAGTGSEATKNAVLSEVGPEGFKKSLRHDNFVPRVAVIDPELHLDTPPEITTAGGLDAVTQLLEAYVSTQANPVTDALALQGLHLAGRALPRLIAGADGVSLRRDMALAAYLSGVCLANAGLGAVHGIASPMGALRDIPHGVVCGLLIAPITAATVDRLATRSAAGDGDAAVSIERYRDVARALGDGTGKRDIEALITWLRERAEGLARLSDFGFNGDDLTRIGAASGLKNHPYPLSDDELVSAMKEVL